MLVWHPVFSSKAEPRTVSSWVLPAVIQEPGLMRLAQVASTISQVADIWRLDMRRQRKCDQSSFPSDTIQAHVQNWLEKLGNLVKQCPQQEDVGNWYGGQLLTTSDFGLVVLDLKGTLQRHVCTQSRQRIHNLVETSPVEYNKRCQRFG